MRNITGFRQKGRIFVLINCLLTVLLSVDASGEEAFLPATSARVYSSELYPCSSCHAYMQTTGDQRPLEFHKDISTGRHTEGILWCLDCHDRLNRDRLRLLNKKRIDFASVHRLCGQCHGSIYRDWKAGVHGKRIGQWNGPKRYYLCTTCHDPHSPRFKPLKPEPPPLKPVETLR